MNRWQANPRRRRRAARLAAEAVGGALLILGTITVAAVWTVIVWALVRL